MGVDRSERFRTLVHGELLVGMLKIQLCKRLASRLGSKMLLYLRQGVRIQLRILVYGQPIVATDANRSVTLHYWHDGCSSVRKFDWCHDPFPLEPLELFSLPLPSAQMAQGVACGSGVEHLH